MNVRMQVQQSQVRRTSEIEEVTNRYLIHPMSEALVRPLARWGVRPNTVSVLGMCFGGLAAVAYYHYADWPYAVAGFLFMVGWHVLDGADGQLARLTGQTSEVGKILDGLCDHLSFALVYLSLTLAAASVLGWWIWIAAVLAGLSHLAQASAYEFRRQSYDFWGHGKETARLDTPEAARRALAGKRGAARLFGHLYITYLRLQHWMAGTDGDLAEAMDRALRRAAGPDERAEIRSVYRAAHVEIVRRWGLLSSNYRTVAIFVAALLGSPLYFFLFETVVLNAVFGGLRVVQADQNQSLRAWLAEAGKPEPQPVLSDPV
jgi:phosphatidylglycerophosphate synthase